MGKPHKLTQKQENFCWKYIETGNAHTAYIKAYDVYSLNQKENWTYVEASNLLKNPKIAQRINEIQQQISSEQITTLDRILFELEQARILGLEKLVKLNQQLDEQLEKNNE